MAHVQSQGTLAPTLAMFPTGGFLSSGVVGLWGILGPLGALVFSTVRASVRWFILFTVAFLTAGIAGELTGGLSQLPKWFSTTMLALNVVVGGGVVFTLLAVFARQRQDAQERADTLLINILPHSIAEKLKAMPQTIAESFTSASILFADVVDFTPMAERVPPVRVVEMLEVAGVIGRKRFLYDLWGDAVNTAGRMQTDGTPGRIQITRATYDLLKDEFVCEPRGTVLIKGKGEMET